jgi:hypothetical protein
MRIVTIASYALLALAGAAFCMPTFEEEYQDTAKKKELDKGLKALDKYFKAEADIAKGGRKQASAQVAQEAAQTEFLEWLAATKDTLGSDKRAEPDYVIDMIDAARVKYLETKLKRGSIEYVKVDDAAGMKRHEYALLVPKAYDPKKRMPVVITLHGRVINPRHPAFRNAPFDERSREAIWNNWFKTPGAEEALVVAPTTSPDGFLFGDNHYEDLQTTYRTLGEVLTHYRGDWERVFIEVHGRALRVACETSLLFAGFIVRDRVDDRRGPPLPPEEFCLLENLNGVPLLYVADAANWEVAGKPMSEALTAAYQAAGKAENLVVIQAQRDVDGALRGGEDQIAEFVKKHARPKVRETFRWRFFEEWQGHPYPPLSLTLMNFNFDVSPEAKNAPLADKCGRIVFEAKRETVTDAEGNQKPVNRIDLKVTEAEGLQLFLYEPLVNLDLPITVTINGKPAKMEDGSEFTGKHLERDWEMFFDDVLPRRFFMTPVLSRVGLSFEHVPEFNPPKAPEQAAEEEGDDDEDGEDDGDDDAPTGDADAPDESSPK